MISVYTGTNTANKKIRMLVVQHSLKTGGTEKALLTFLNIFPKEKYQIDLALINHEQDEAKLLDLVPEHICILPAIKQFQKWTPELMEELQNCGMKKEAEIRTYVHQRNEDEQFKQLPKAQRYTENWKLLSRICPVYEGYDIAIAFNRELPLKIVATSAPGKQRIVFVQVNFLSMIDIGEYDKEYLLSNEVYYEKYDKIICLSKENATSFCTLFPKLSGKINILPHIRIKSDMMCQAKEYIPSEYKENVFNILTIARLNKQKGIDLLLKSAYQLKKKIPDFLWLVIGRDDGGEYSMNCRLMINSLELSDNIYLLGERTNVLPYYLYCDLYVQTSYTEGLCGTIEEAKIFGCPIITTDFSTVVDQIKNEENGIICKKEPGNIAQAVYDLYRNENKRKKIANANRNYHSNENIEEYLSHFTI